MNENELKMPAEISESGTAAEQADTVVPEVVEEATQLVPKARAAEGGTLAMFETDPVAESKGVWFKDFVTGVRLRCAHQDNDNFTEYFQQLLAPYISLVQSKSQEGMKFVRRCEAKARSRFVLLDWEGITDAEGNEIPYSESKAFQFLTERKYRKIRRLVESFSADDSAFGKADPGVQGKD